MSFECVGHASVFLIEVVVDLKDAGVRGRLLHGQLLDCVCDILSWLLIR